jgi:lipoprotein-releasing system permease protein
VATAAMIIVLSAFNGIEQTAVELYDDYDQDLTVQLAKSKTMNESLFPFEKLELLNGVDQVSRVVEEVVIVKHQDKWANAKIFGVDTVFLSMSNMRAKVMDSMPAKIYDGERPLAMIGAGVFGKLGIYLTKDYSDYDRVILYAPFRDAKSTTSSSSFGTIEVGVVSRFNYNKDVNDSYVVVPIDLARELLHYGNDVTFLAISLRPGIDIEEAKVDLQEILGDDFKVRSRYEKNELIYKTSRVEKLISIIVLSFIFLLATFNMIASLSMLYIEKQKDILTLKSMGASKKFVFKIFFYEGMMINFLGMLLGLAYGSAICLAQIRYGILTVQNTDEEVIPVIFNSSDFILIITLISVLGAMACFIPVRILMNRSKAFA